MTNNFNFKPDMRVYMKAAKFFDGPVRNTWVIAKVMGNDHTAHLDDLKGSLVSYRNGTHVQEAERHGPTEYRHRFRSKMGKPEFVTGALVVDLLVGGDLVVLFDNRFWTVSRHDAKVFNPKTDDYDSALDTRWAFTPKGKR